MKKNIKLIIILSIVFLSTGCSVVYDLDIKNEFVTEKVTIANHKLTEKEEKIYFDNLITVDINDPCILDYDTQSDNAEVATNNNKKTYYNIFKDKKNLVALSEIAYSNYNNSRLANYLFNNMNVNNDSESISIYGYNGLQAFLFNPNINDITVNINTNKYKVLESDADKITKNIYTWYFNKKTSDKKTLYIKLSKNEYKKEQHNVYSGYIIIGIFLSCLIILGIIKIYNKNKH